MKKPPLVLLVFILLSITFTRAEKFHIDSLGKVTIGKNAFSSMLEYVQSDYFRENKKRCLVKHRPKVEWRSEKTTPCDMNHTEIMEEYWERGTLTIPVVFHVVYRNDGTGNISEERIQEQIQVINEDFRAMAGSMGGEGYDTGIQFQLEEINRVQNNDWFDDKDEYGMKRQLRRDPENYLNIYSNSAGGYLGYSYLPQELNSGSVYDGVVVLYETIGGRDNGYAPYDQGRTLTHELGHYFGLLHPFDNGSNCENGYDVGDLILDTRSENSEHYGCSQTNSCGTPDNIHNYMNYTDDACMTEFTGEQANRMVCTIVNYRPDLPLAEEPSLELNSPNGGESFYYPEDVEITWNSNEVSTVNLYFLNGESEELIAGNLTGVQTYTWKTPKLNSTQCKIKIFAPSEDLTAVSENEFAVHYFPSLDFVEPGDGGFWRKGTEVSISWNYQGPDIYGTFYLKRNSEKRGFEENAIIGDSVFLYDSSFSHYLPGNTMVGDDYYLECETRFDGQSFKFASSVFEIYDSGAISFLNDFTGDTLLGGDSIRVEWSATENVDSVKLLAKYSGMEDFEDIFEKMENNGGCFWDIPDIFDDSVFLRIEKQGDESVCSQMGPFSVVPPKNIRLVTPREGDTLYMDDSLNVTWESDWREVPVDLLLFYNENDSVFFGNMADSGKLVVRELEREGDSCFVVVRNHIYKEDREKSPYFSIKPPFLEKPAIELESGQDTLFEKDSVFFRGIVSDPPSNCQYYWDFGNGLNSHELEPGYTRFDLAGTYNVYFWYSFNDYSSDSAKVSINIHLPNPEIISPSADTSVFINDSLLLRGTSYEGESVVSEIWALSNGDTLGGNSPGEYSFRSAGKYAMDYYFQKDSLFSKKSRRIVTVEKNKNRFLDLIHYPDVFYDGIVFCLDWESNIPCEASLKYGKNRENMNSFVDFQEGDRFFTLLEKDSSIDKIYYQIELVNNEDTVQMEMDSIVKSRYYPDELILKHHGGYSKGGSHLIELTANMPVKARLYYGSNENELNKMIVAAGFKEYHPFEINGTGNDSVLYYRIQLESPGGEIKMFPDSSSSYSYVIHDKNDHFPFFSLEPSFFIFKENRLGLLWETELPFDCKIGLIYDGVDSLLGYKKEKRVKRYFTFRNLPEKACSIRLEMAGLDEEHKDLVLPVVKMDELEERFPKSELAPESVKEADYARINWLTDVVATSAIRWGTSSDSLRYYKESNRLNNEHLYYLPLRNELYYQIRDDGNKNYNVGDWSQLYRIAFTDMTDAETFKDEYGKMIIECFPNPVTRYLQVRVQGNERRDVELFVYDILGRKLWNKKLSSSCKELTLDFDDLNGEKASSGIYFLVSYYGNSYEIKKFILMR